MTRLSSYTDLFTVNGVPPAERWPEIVRDIAEVQYPARLNASVELLDRTIELVGRDKTAVIADDGTLSYGQLLHQVSQVAHLLRDAGLQSGNRVLLRMPNNGWLVTCWLAVLRAGGVVVTTIPAIRSGEISQILEVCRPNFAIIDHRYLQDWTDTGVHEIPVFVVGDGNPDSLEAQASRKETQFEPHDSLAEDTCILAFTSGTTGKPKATMHDHQDVLAIADTFSAHVVKPRAADIFSGSPPAAFTFGLGGLVVFPLRVGATTVLLEAGSPQNLLAAIEKHKISCLFTAPTAYRAMLHQITQSNQSGEFDLSSLRRCISAGEALPETVWHQWFEATGLKLIDGIGATEMLHIFISASDDEIRPGFTGKAVPGYVATVLGEDLQPLPVGAQGRLAVRGPTGCRYFNDERQSVYVQQGWNLTGDIYEMTEDGYFKYLARADDMIVSSGYNIAAPEVENALLTHPAVSEVAVIGEPDEDRGVVVKAFVVMAPNHLPSDQSAEQQMRKELQDHVKQTIAPFKYPRIIEFVSQLPKSPTGKLQRHRLRTNEIKD